MKRGVGIKAIQAGCDIIFVSRRYEYEQKIFDGIIDAIHDGKISENRIDESVRRIIRAKIQANLIS